MRKIILFAAALLLADLSVNAQAITGTINVPSVTYPTLASAITALNTQSISGNVYVDIAAGYTEVAPVGGYSLTVSGASSNTLTFEKSGAGANPQITAYTGTATPSSVLQDGLFRLIGSDYIVIDGIDLFDGNTTNPGTMEFGYGFFKASTTDGCQFNTIKNCNISLSTVNNASGNTTAVDGSRGIDVVNALSGAHPTPLTGLTGSGAGNSNNKFYNNVIQNCNIGIALIGFADVSPFTAADQGNDIGGLSATTSNTIINFGGVSGATNPSAGIRTLAQYGLNISYNIVNNNNGSGANHVSTLRGIYLNTALNASESITNNTVTVKSGSTGSALTAIDNVAGGTGSGNLTNISNNLITNCTYTGAVSGIFTGIVNSASTASLNVLNNSFINNSTAATGGTQLLISNSGAVVSVINMNNNSINGFNFTGLHTSSFHLINNTGGASTATLNANGNTFQNILNNVAASTSYNFIRNTGTPRAQVFNNNTFNNLILNTSGSVNFISNDVALSSTGLVSVNNNSIITGFSKTGAGGTVFLYQTTTGPSSAVGSVKTYQNNNFSNITLTGATTMSGWADLEGATGGGASKTISNNKFTNWTCGSSAVTVIQTNYGNNNTSIASNTITNISGTGAITGISIGTSNAGAVQSISNNIISNFVSSSTGGAINGITGGLSSVTTFSIINNTVSSFSTVGTSATALAVNFGATNYIIKNKVYDLQANNASGIVTGILVSGGTTNHVYNNLVGDLRAPVTSAANAIIGISITGGTTDNVSFNSVNINGSSSGANFGSSAISVNTTPTTINLRNNIFVNTSAPAGTGLTVAYRRASTVLTNYGSASNNNLFYAGSVGASNLIMYDGTNSYQTISAYKTAVSPRDAASVTENPPFLSTVGSNSNFLNINTSAPTQIESGGTPVSGISDDYAGNSRNASTPDIGAWEGNYTFTDMAAPVIGSVGFTSSMCNLSGRSFTVNISDATGTATGTLSPMVYYKVNGGLYSSSQGTLTSGTVLNGVWTFSMAYSVVLNDVISYFVIAQDASPNNNLVSNPSAGLVATDVNNVTTPPTAPYSYTIAGSLSGLYTVGAAGTYSTLTAASIAYNTSCLSGPVTFQLIDPTYSTAETFPIVFVNNMDASSTNSLLITTNTGINALISGTNTSASAVVKFLNARFITIDGTFGGGSIAMTNPNTGTSADIWLASGGSGNNNISIKNLTLNGGSNTATGNYGIIAGLDGATPSTTGGADNDNIIISGNTILKVYYGIYASGTTSLTVGGLDNWSVSTNSIGPVTAGTANIGNSGIYIQYMVNPTINNNIVRNVVTSSTSNGGIYLLSNVNGASVSQNTITNVSTTSSGSDATSISGIYFGLNVRNSSISKNVISTIINSNTGGWGSRGIILSTGVATSSISVYNNMISDIYSYSDVGASYWPVGINLDGVTGGVDIAFNTISLFGSHTGLTGGTGSTPLYINTGSTGGLLIRNNIFSNTYDNSNSSTDIAYSIYSTVANTNFVTIDYNDYYVGGTGNVQTLGYLGGAQSTLPALKAAFGQNVNSINAAPLFNSGTDLHLQLVSGNIPLDNFGTPITGITTDIDNQTRNISAPDMGADEFTVPTCTTANGGTITPASFTACEGQTLAISTTSASTGINTVYQWMYSTVSGGSYSVVGGGTGANTTSYITPTLSAGVYYVVLQAQCTSASLTAISNEATVTVNSNPTIAVSPLSSTICMPGGVAVGLTASGGNSYTWSPSSGITGSGSSVNALPVSTTVYTVTGNNGAGCISKATTTVNISQYPTLNPITATPATVCVGGSSTLQAVATLTSYGVMSIPYAAVPVPGSGVTTLCNNGTASVPLTSGSLDDGGWSNQALPFSFNFFGTNYNSFAVSTNGFVFLGTGSPATFSGYSNAFPSTSAARPSIGAVYSDLDFDGVGSGSTIQYFTVGTSPNQQLVVRWSGQFWSNTGTVTTQAILYETSNIIEVHTFTSTGTNTGVLGIQNPAGNGAYVAPGRNSVTWPVSTPDAYRFTPTTLSYSWTPSTYLNSTTIANPVAGNITGSIAYSLNVIGSNGCTTLGTKTISVDIPTVTITGPTVSCAGNSITLTGNGTTSYSWSTGSTSASINDAPTTTTTYSVVGTNTVTGCTANAMQTVSVNPLPNVGVTGSSVICSGQTASLSASGASTYTWNTSATSASITDTPTSNTTYSVTGTDANGCTNTAMQTVTVNSLPVITITGTNSVCDGVSASLTGNGATTYSWNTGATSANISVTPSISTSYTVTGTDANNCSDTASFMLTVNPNPTITVAGGAICPGGSFTLTPTGASTYTFLPNGPIVTPGSTTTYSVSGTDALGCMSQTAATAVVTVTNNLSVTITGNTAVCFGQSSSLTAGGASTYSWSTGASTSTIVSTPTTNTTYSVTGSSGTCSNTAVVTITVNPLPSVSLSASSTTACTNGSTVSLSGSPSGGIYSGSNVTGNIFTPPATSGTFTPSYSYTDAITGCSDSANTTIVVSVCTGINNNARGLTGLKVYPNPNIGEFTIELGNGATKNVEVSDLMGRIILSGSTNNDRMNVNISNLANGVYFVKVMSNNSVEIVRIIKQ